MNERKTPPSMVPDHLREQATTRDVRPQGVDTPMPEPATPIGALPEAIFVPEVVKSYPLANGWTHCYGETSWGTNRHWLRDPDGKDYPSARYEDPAIAGVDEVCFVCWTEYWEGHHFPADVLQVLETVKEAQK